MISHMNLWFLPNSRFLFVLYLSSFTFSVPENLSRYLQRRNNQQRKCSGEKRKKITLCIRLWGWRSRTQDSSMWTHRLDRRHVRDFGHIRTWRFLISLYDMFLFIATIIIIVIFMTVDEIVSVKTEPVSGRFFRVFDSGWNNCYFDSTVKNTNMPRNKFLRHGLVSTGTITIQYSIFTVLSFSPKLLSSSPSQFLFSSK